MIKTLEHFDTFNSKYSASAEVAALRQWGKKWSDKLGVPSRRSEDWKYTSLKFLTERSYKPALLTETKKTSVELPEGFFHILFQNGKLESKLNDLQKYFEFQDDDFKSVTNLIGPVNVGSMDALNAAFAGQHLSLKLKDNTSLPKPLMITHFSDQSGTSVFPNIQIVVGKASKMSLTESFISKTDVLMDAVTSIKLEENSNLTYAQVLSEDLKAVNYRKVDIYLKANSNLHSLVIANGGEIVRQNLNCYFVGKAASAKLNAITIGGQKSHIDHHTLVDHVIGECSSTQLYKSILDGESRSVFDGRVLIRKDAQKANSDQLNQNLLLSSKAEADTKPNLEIFADDVKATHGATVGQLDEEELFYLRTRAISKEKALEMLSLGYVVDLTDDIENETLKSWLVLQVKDFYQRMKT